MHHRITNGMTAPQIRKSIFRSNSLNESVTLLLRSGTITHQFTKKPLPYDFNEVNQIVKSIDLDISKANDLKNKNI